MENHSAIMSIKATKKDNSKISNSAKEYNTAKNFHFPSKDSATSVIKKIWWPRVLFAMLLIFFTAFVYLSSLDKFFIEDQLLYFSELNGETSLASGFRLLDYGAHRQQIDREDAILYRPFIFALLAFENTFFHRDYRLWNIANLVLHLLVSYLLFEFLWHINRTLLAFGFSLLFALLISNFGLVTWNHLGGYMLGYGLLLIALWMVRVIIRDEKYSGVWRFWIYGFVMISAMLFHEIAVIAAFGIIVYFSWYQRKKLNTNWGKFIIATGMPILIYIALFSFHFFQINKFLWIRHGGSIIEHLLYIPLLILYWLQHIFLPLPGQLVFSHMEQSSWTLPYGAFMPDVIVPSVLWIMVLICLRRGFEWKHLKESLPFVALIFFMIVSYASIITFGRFRHALQVSHYDYFPALFGTILLYSIIDFSKVLRLEKVGALVCLFLLVLYNGLEVRNISCRVHEVYSPAAKYLKLIEQKIRPRLADPNFSFALKDIPTGPSGAKYPDKGFSLVVPLLQVLYGKYYNPATPSDILIVKDFHTGTIDLLSVK